MFIYLVNVFNGMPGGKIVGIVFYVCVLFAGMSSLVNLYEAPVATIQEKLKLNRVASVGIIAVAGCVVSLVIQGMDGRSIYLYLPTWRNARSNYVLLGCRKEVCC